MQVRSRILGPGDHNWNFPCTSSPFHTLVPFACLLFGALVSWGPENIIETFHVDTVLVTSGISSALVPFVCFLFSLLVSLGLYTIFKTSQTFIFQIYLPNISFSFSRFKFKSQGLEVEWKPPRQLLFAGPVWLWSAIFLRNISSARKRSLAPSFVSFPFFSILRLGSWLGFPMNIYWSELSGFGTNFSLVSLIAVTVLHHVFICVFMFILMFYNVGMFYY